MAAVFVSFRALSLVEMGATKIEFGGFLVMGFADLPEKKVRTTDTQPMM